MKSDMNDSPLLAVNNLSVDFKHPDRRIARAVVDVSFTIRAGERVALVGESGSGKSTVANAILRIEDPGEIHPESTILLNGVDMTAMRESDLRLVRGNTVSRIPQNSNSSLNPVHTIGAQIVEAIRAHKDVSKQEATEHALRLLRDVQIPDAETRMGAYPHQFSGGMAQRVFIAMALAASPDLLIADEPTTNLDVSVQAEVLELLDQQVQDRNMALLLITHDLAIVANLCDRVLVMYGGRIVEAGTTEEIFGAGAHPYTKDLLASVPRVDEDGDNLFPSISGNPPDPAEEITGCPYRLRGCAFATEQCATELPSLEMVGPGHTSACHESLAVQKMNGEIHVR